MNKYINILFEGITSKENESIDDCQDACQFNENCIAIADGASQSLYPKVWAELLVEHFCNNPDKIKEDWQKWLVPIQEEWLQTITKRIEIAKSKNNPTWIDNQNRLNQFVSAKSTFVGLQIKDNQMNISMIGDSCLFIWQDNKFKECIPYNSSSEFNDSPNFFAGFSRDNKFKPLFYKKNIDKIENTFYVLATDAFSQWILENIEAKKDVLPILQNIKTQKDFDKLLSDARNSKEIKLKNDDVALITFQLSDNKNKGFTIQETPQEEEIIIKDNLQDNLTNNSLTEVKKEKSIIIDGLIVENDKLEKRNKKLIEINKKLKKINKWLKVGLLFVIVLSVLLFFIPKMFQNQELVSKPIVANEPTRIQKPIVKEEAKQPPTPKTMRLLKGTIVYNKDDKNAKQFKAALNTDCDVIVLEESDDWIKFEIELFVSKSVIKQQSDTDVTINIGNNVRISPDTKADVFGAMNTQTHFYKIQNENKDWIKFKFVGYSKKKE